VFDDQQVTTTNPSRFPNPNLKWETTTQIDIGLEIGLFDDRLYGTVDYYQKDTEDMLLQLPVPTSTGFSTRLSNIGSIKNTGLEVSLESQNLTGALTWNTNANFSTMSNEVESLGPVEEIITGGAGFTNQISIIQPGLPLRTYYGYEVEGVWQEGDNFTGTKDNVSVPVISSFATSMETARSRRRIEFLSETPFRTFPGHWATRSITKESGCTSSFEESTGCRCSIITSSTRTSPLTSAGISLPSPTSIAGPRRIPPTSIRPS
jgi:hypothetical protein